MTDVETVAVVGGGAVGVTAANDLAAAGADVTLFERGSIAAGSTGRAAGICYDAFAGRRDARIAARAMARFREIAAGTRVPFTGHPYVWFARTGDDEHAAAIREQVPRMREHGRDVALLDDSGFHAEFPRLRHEDVAVAAVARDAAVTDPGTYAEVLAERARDAGARIVTDATVGVDPDPAVETPDGREGFDAVLVAAGADTKRLLADAGVAIAMKPYRVQALVTDPVADSDRTPIWYDATAGVYCRPHSAGFLVGDGTEEREFDPEDWERDADDSFVASALARLADAVRLDDSPGVRRAWAGLCTATPDRDPLLGEIRPGLFVATGFHGHGFMRAPALGESVAEEMLGGEGLEAFDPARFDGDESFPVVEGMTVD